MERRWNYFYAPMALLLLGLCLLIRRDDFRETVRYSLQGFALPFVFIAAIRFHRWPLFALSNTRPMVFIGLPPYSLYLMHFAVIGCIGRLMPAGA